MTMTRNQFVARGRILVVSALLLAGGVAAFAYTQNKPTADGKPDAAKPEAGKPEAAALVFSPNDVANAELRALARTLAISGSLTPVAQSVVKARSAGEVLRIHVREGERVAKGQVLAEIDATDVRNRLAAAEADLEERRARLSIASRNRDNNEALLKRNFISQNAFDQTLSTFQGAEAAVRGGEAQVRLARTALEDTLVRAPLAGIVAKRNVNAGDRVVPEAPLLTVVDLTRLELEITVPASDIGEIAVGQAARFRVDGYGQREFSGKVGRINPVADAGSRAIKLFVDVPNADQVLKGGMFAQGGLLLAEAKPLPTVPSTALFEEAGQNYAYVVAAGRLDKRALKLGISDAASGLVAIESGLQPGEQVVRLRMNGLKAGAAAEVRDIKS
jgi:RND family efflux transporter MFP subunit